MSFLKPGTSSLFGNSGDKPPVTGSLFGQNKNLFGEGFGKATETPANGNEDSDGAYKNEEEAPTLKLEDQTISKSPFSKIFEKEV